MRTVRIYQPGPYDKGHQVELSATASQHVGVVLRMQVGDPLCLFCGDNREFKARIIAVQKKKVVVSIDDVAPVSRESPLSIHLAQGISKGDRMEWVIQKAVELGVQQITPLMTTHCVVRLDSDRLNKKLAQWQAIAIAAAEQSGRNQLTIIHPARTLDAYIQDCGATTKRILDPNATQSWRNHTDTKGDIALIIGPEGGFSEAEIIRAQDFGFEPLSLGPRILRTETAAIAALSMIQGTDGDL